MQISKSASQNLFCCKNSAETIYKSAVKWYNKDNFKLKRNV